MFWFQDTLSGGVSFFLAQNEQWSGPGPPVHARARRLPPERLAIARMEFDHMLQLGIVRPSSSMWANPLHMVSKKTPGDWRP